MAAVPVQLVGPSDPPGSRRGHCRTIGNPCVSCSRPLAGHGAAHRACRVRPEILRLARIIRNPGGFLMTQLAGRMESWSNTKSLQTTWRSECIQAPEGSLENVGIHWELLMVSCALTKTTWCSTVRTGAQRIGTRIRPTTESSADR